MKLTMTCIAAVMMATTAAAQDHCGGAGAGGQWIGGTRPASDITLADAHREQLALVLGDAPYVGLFSLSDTTSVRIEAAGRGAGDPLIEIFNAEGGIVASDDDSGGGGAARADLELAAGQYCVAMKSYENAPMSAFMRIGRAEHDALTDGTVETPAATTDAGCDTARPFGPLGTAQSVAVDETAYWSFTLDAPTALTITAQNNDADPAIKLFDNAGTQIAADDDTDGLNARIQEITPIPAGDYCLNVGAINDTALPIDISIRAYDPAAALAALYAKGEAAPPLDGSVDITPLGTLDTRLRRDVQAGNDTVWHTLDVPQSGLMLIEAIATSAQDDPWLVVYDDLGRQIGQNDDASAGNLNSMVTARVQSGTYIIGVKQIGDDKTGFIRLVLERYVPAK